MAVSRHSLLSNVLTPLELPLSPPIFQAKREEDEHERKQWKSYGLSAETWVHPDRSSELLRPHPSAQVGTREG
jgi:hypothetical protein